MARERAKGVASASGVRGELARVAAWALGLDALVQAVGALLSQHRAGALAVQAFATEWGTGRLGVAWSDPERPPPDAATVARRLGRGAVIGCGAAAVAVGFALATHASRLGALGVSPSALGTGAILAGFVAVRDELLLRGLVLRTFRHALGPVSRLLVCGAVGFAARLGSLADPPLTRLLDDPSGPAAAGAAGLAAIGFASLWMRERGAWSAVGAHALFTFTTTTAISGGLCDVRWASTAWGGGTGGFEGSLAALVVLAALAVVATLTQVRLEKRTG